MTTPDAGQRLIDQLRKDARLFPSMESIRKAADEIERLRGVEARLRFIREHCLVEYAPQKGIGWIAERRITGFASLDERLDAAIAASRSTGAADVGEDQ